MSERLNRMVGEFFGARMGLKRLTAWRRFQLGVHLVVPTMVSRFVDLNITGKLSPMYSPYDQEQAYVFLFGEESRVVRVAVNAVLEDKAFVEPAAGLAVGDRIVVAGQAGLKDGALVELPDEKDEAKDDEKDQEEGADADAQVESATEVGAVAEKNASQEGAAG